jgi:hypothetical protein
MPNPAQLFSSDAAALLAEWGLAPTTQQSQIHTALATRSLLPDEAHLRQAAAWLAVLFQHHQTHPRFGPHVLAAVLDEKSALLHRLAYRHVPRLGAELEHPDSPLHAIDAAARFLPDASAVTSPHMAALRQTLAALALPDTPPPGADPAWHDNRRRLQQLILHDNPARFLTWPVILNSMFMNDLSVAAPELAALQAQPDYATRWQPALREDALGAPARTPLHPNSSNNLIHHAYNLLQLGHNVEQLPTILEFGGGYGSTARLAFRLGFRGRYVIFDLPEFFALQRFYLGTLGLPVARDPTAGTPAIHCISTMEALQTLFPQHNPALFLATWSFSETPPAFRRQFLPLLRNAHRLLIAYQHSFGNADNLASFADLARHLPGRRVRDYAIDHLPGNRYFVAAPA